MYDKNHMIMKRGTFKTKPGSKSMACFPHMKSRNKLQGFQPGGLFETVELGVNSRSHLSHKKAGWFGEDYCNHKFVITKDPNRNKPCRNGCFRFKIRLSIRETTAAYYGVSDTSRLVLLCRLPGLQKECEHQRQRCHCVPRYELKKIGTPRFFQKPWMYLGKL